MDEAKARHGHDTADASEHENEASRDLGLVIHLHGAESEDGQECEQPVCRGIDDAVCVLNALHGVPTDTHRVMIATVKVGRAAATEDGEEEGSKAEGCVNTNADLHDNTLPSLQEDAIEGDCQRGFEEYVAQSVESELENLVLLDSSVSRSPMPKSASKTYSNIDCGNLDIFQIPSNGNEKATIGCEDELGAS